MCTNKEYDLLAAEIPALGNDYTYATIFQATHHVGCV